MRLELEGGKGAVVSEQQSQMTESRDGRKLKFEHRASSTASATSELKGEATLGDDGAARRGSASPRASRSRCPRARCSPTP